MNWETVNTFHKSLPSNSSECLVLIRDSVFRHCSSSVIRQQCKSQNGCFKKQSTPNFPKNEHFLPPDAHTAHHGVMFVFRKIWRALFFEAPVVRFAFLHDYRRVQEITLGFTMIICQLQGYALHIFAFL